MTRATLVLIIVAAAGCSRSTSVNSANEISAPREGADAGLDAASPIAAAAQIETPPRECVSADEALVFSALRGASLFACVGTSARCFTFDLVGRTTTGASAEDAGTPRWSGRTRDTVYVYSATASEVKVCDRRAPPTCRAFKPGFLHPLHPSEHGYANHIVGDVSPDGTRAFVLHSVPTGEAGAKVTGETFLVDAGERIAQVDLTSMFGSDPVSNVWHVRWVGDSVQVASNLGSGPVDHGSRLYDPLTGAPRPPGYAEVALAAGRPDTRRDAGPPNDALLLFLHARTGWVGYPQQASSFEPHRVALPFGGRTVATHFHEGRVLVVKDRPVEIYSLDPASRKVTLLGAPPTCALLPARME